MRKLLLLISLFFSFALHAATWLSSGQYDISWYSSSKSEFTIRTAKQFAGIAYLVNNSYTTFSGKTIYLDSDISLSDNTWVSVGNADGSKCFQGKLNGQGHTISGLYIRLDNGNYPNYGLFAQLRNAEISNLICKGYVYLDYEDEMYKVEAKAGLLVAYAKNTIFNNCTSVASVDYKRLRTQGSYPYKVSLGGIAGEIESCEVTSCSYEGDFNLTLGVNGTGNANHNGGSIYMGGIVGKATGGTFKFCGTIADSFKASLSSSKQHNEVDTYIGGIAGFVNSKTKFDACYSNIGKFETSLPRTTTGSGSGSAHFFVGGITSCTSFGWDTGHIYNCYSSCDMLNAFGQAVKYGGICGKADASDNKYEANFSPSSMSGTYDDQYVITSEGYDGSTTFSVSEMESNSFLDELNLYPMLNGLDYIWTFIPQNSFPVIGDKPAGLSYKILSATNKTAEVVAPATGTYQGDIVIPTTVKIGNDTYTVVQIGEKAFYQCTGLTSIELPNTITTIKNSAFYDCKNLESFTMPNSVTEIYGYAFWKCRIKKLYIYDLQKWCNINFRENTGANPLCYSRGEMFLNNQKIVDLNLPEGTKLSFAAFTGCSSIKAVTFPSNFIGFSDGCGFQYCRRLKTIRISNSVYKIPGYTFANCPDLSDVFCEATTPPKLDIGWNNVSFDEYYAFVGCNLESVTLHIPKGCRDAYATAPGWKNFKTILEDYDKSGIDEIYEDLDNHSDSEIYNLNGVKVSESTDNLAPGIYIVRQGSTVKKIIVH